MTIKSNTKMEAVYTKLNGELRTLKFIVDLDKPQPVGYEEKGLLAVLDTDKGAYRCLNLKTVIELKELNK